MANLTTLPLSAHEDRSAFLEHAWNIGRAYRRQATELISICQLLSTTEPKVEHEYDELRRIRHACDLALQSAAASGTKTIDRTTDQFNETTEMLSSHLERMHHLGHPLTVYSKMEIARLKDGLETDWSHSESDEFTVTITINFMLLRSPLLSLRDPKTIIMSQELSASPTLPEILWNFSRYKDNARITLEQNPHFYLHFPADESGYTSTFRLHPLQDASGVLQVEHNDTVYVLFDGPARVFLHTEHNSRIFGNIWMINGFLIFRDISGVLEGEQLVGGSGTRYNLQYCEQPEVYHDSELRSHRLNHSHLRPVVTASRSANPLSDEALAFEDWTALSCTASHSTDTHIYGLRESPGYTCSLDLPPPPPTSEQPEYQVLYQTRVINTVNDDILLGIFNCYRLANENVWNVRLGWCKLSHVCQRWRRLIFESAFHLGMHILCTNGTPTVDTLSHLPPLPLFVDYRDSDQDSYLDLDGRLSENGGDESAICQALQLRDRACHITLHLQSSTLHKYLMLLDEPFPKLEHLSLSSPADMLTTLTLPKTFLAPNLRHLSLLRIHLPKRLRLLSFTVSLVTLELADIQASSYFRPRLLVVRLGSLPQLEELSIGFSVPIPRPSTERLLLGGKGTPVILSKLKCFTFRGVSAYLERLVSQMRVPVLEKLDITLFNEIAFRLPHLSRLVNITEQIKRDTAAIIFERNMVAIFMANSTGVIGDTDDSDACKPFILRVMCKPRDWQIDCAMQICGALMPTLTCVKKLTLSPTFNRPSNVWHRIVVNLDKQDYEIDGTTWHELLRTFVGVKVLFIDQKFCDELSRALEVDEIGFDSGLLPNLQELVCEYRRARVGTLFSAFIHARQVVGRPVSLQLTPITPSSDHGGLYGPRSPVL